MKTNTVLSQRVLWLFPLVAVAPLGLDICIPGMTTIAEAFNSSAATTQWLISGFIISLSLGQLVFGPLVDRFSPQRIFTLGCCIYFLGAILIYFAESISVLIGLRLLQGIGASAAAVAVFASVPKLFNGRDIGRIFSLLNGVISIVPVLAPIVGGALIVHYGWEASFYFLSGYLLLCFILIRFRPLPLEINQTSINLQIIIGNYREVLKHPNFRLGMVASSCGFASQLIFFSSSPIVIIDQFAVPIDQFGFYFAVNAVAITAGSLSVSFLLKTLKEPPILLFGAGSLLVAAVGFTLANGLWGDTNIVWRFIIPATVGSFGFALLMGAGASKALSPFKALSGTAAALIATIQMSFASIVAWICIQFWMPDWSSVIISYALLSATIALAVFRYRKTETVVKFKKK